MFKDVVDRFAKQSPVSVMARAALENALSADSVNELFAANAETQYARTMLFSSAVDLMSLVVMGIRPSIHAAYQATPEEVGVSITAVYDKLQRIEPAVSEALVTQSSERLGAVIDATGGRLPNLLPGYHVRILDGNCLAATEHRIDELRSIAAGPLPGKSLVVYDPSRMLMTNVFCCEDGHAQERSLLDRVVEIVKAKDCWIADRNFCVAGFFARIAERNGYFVIRWHRQLSWKERGPWRESGPTETGYVFERPVEIRVGNGRKLPLRLIRINLETPTRDGDTELFILSNLPDKVSAMTISELLRKRWTLETAFQQLTQNLRCEINTLGYPAAALFGFCVAVACFNAISTIRAAMRAAHGAKKIEEEVSSYYLADEIAGVARGMEIAIDNHHWERYATMPAQQFANYLVRLAKQIKLSAFRRHPRGPKKPPTPRKRKKGEPHVSTKRILNKRVATE